MEEAMVNSIYDRQCGELVTETQRGKEWSQFMSFVTMQNKHWTGNEVIDQYLVTWNNRISVWANHVIEAQEANVLGMLVASQALADLFSAVMQEVIDMVNQKKWTSLYDRHAPSLQEAWSYLEGAFAPSKLDICTCLKEPYGQLFINLNPGYPTSNLLSQLKHLDNIVKEQLSA